MRKIDWADKFAHAIVEAHTNTWGDIPQPDYLMDCIAANLRAVWDRELGPHTPLDPLTPQMRPHKPDDRV